MSDELFYGFMGVLIGFLIMAGLLAMFGVTIPDIEKFGETLCEDKGLGFEDFEEDADKGLIFYCYETESIEDGYLLKVPRGSRSD